MLYNNHHHHHLKNGLFFLSLIFFLRSSMSSDDVPTTTIEGQLFLPILDQATGNFIPYNTTTKITLNHGDDYTTYSRADGKFTIRNVPPGVHVIDVQSVTYHFPQIKCQYKPDIGESTPGGTALSCLEYAYPGAAKKPVVDIPLQIVAMAMYDYFEPRHGFSITGIVKNPMFLMMAFSVVMMLLMPKLMEGMDDEEKARMKQQMEMQKDPTKMFGQLWGEITGSGQEEQPHQNQQARTSAVAKAKKTK